MTCLQKMLMPVLALGLVLAACSDDDGGDTSSDTSGESTTTSQAPAACTEETAVETAHLTIGADGFEVDCAKVTKGTDVSFINDTDEFVRVSLSDPDDINAELQSNGETYSHQFATVGTFRVTSTPGNTLTLFVVD